MSSFYCVFDMHVQRRFKAINQLLLNREASGQKLDMEAERRLRSPEEMSAEAAELRKAMSAFDQ